MIKETFSERIRRVRKSRGLTQAELAERLNISEMTVRRWEAGQRSPRIEATQKLAEVLGTTPEELLSGNPEVNDLPAPLKPEQENKTVFKNTGSALVYERNGERLELPPTEESYQIFRDLAMRIASRNAPAIARHDEAI